MASIMDYVFLTTSPRVKAIYIYTYESLLQMDAIWGAHLNMAIILVDQHK